MVTAKFVVVCVIALACVAVAAVVLRRRRNSGKIVGVFATWCGPCQRFKPEWNTFVETSVLSVEELDADVDKRKVSALGVKSFPTVLYLGKKAGPQEYEGERTAAALAEWASSMTPA